MITVIQRVSEASVTIDNAIKGKIDQGLMILLGIEETDEKEDIDWLVRKVLNLRIFDDEVGVMNKSLVDVEGEILLISQFTLHASTKKGNRPSYIKAAKPDIAIPLYEQFIAALETELGRGIQTGEFGADMKVGLVNDGPVTIIIDSKNKQ
ncbi:D-aminoacyl-tRNA deacylase [Fulvivirga sp.]|uniref:D-aminoacyl-tRNA deacylase n=1 Tax=Fulvivirga sp. TaxID=1931237 RepID=UPI0032ECDA28